jgi:hypothetical protein
MNAVAFDNGIYSSLPKSSESKNDKKCTVKSQHDGISMTSLSVLSFVPVFSAVLRLAAVLRRPQTLVLSILCSFPLNASSHVMDTEL